MTSALDIDRDGIASRLAMEGSVALGNGEIDKAKEKYIEAAEVLETEIATNPPPDVLHMLRFLAATQYYLGGHYAKSRKLAKRIERRFLNNETQLLLDNFLNDVNNRSSKVYLPRMRKKVFDLWNTNQFQQAMKMLQSHPYLYDQMGLAFLRAQLCENLGLWKAAASFHATVAKEMREDSDYMLTIACAVMNIAMEGHIDGAWELISYLRNLLPNALTNLTASLICFQRTKTVSSERRVDMYREQLRYFDEGWRAYQNIIEPTQNDDLRILISLCFDSAVQAALLLGDTSRAKELADEAIRFAPDISDAMTFGGRLPKSESLRWELPHTQHHNSNTRIERLLLAGTT